MDDSVSGEPDIFQTSKSCHIHPSSQYLFNTIRGPCFNMVRKNLVGGRTWQSSLFYAVFYSRRYWPCYLLNNVAMIEFLLSSLLSGCWLDCMGSRQSFPDISAAHRLPGGAGEFIVSREWLILGGREPHSPCTSLLFLCMCIKYCIFPSKWLIPLVLWMLVSAAVRSAWSWRRVKSMVIFFFQLWLGNSCSGEGTR